MFDCKCVFIMLKYLVLVLFVLVPIACDEIQPLFLTPLIRKHQIKKAQKLAEVKPFLSNVKSYSGYLTVDDRYNSNLFFWFFPKESGWKKAPLVLWLQGGPGSSSLFGLFVENGPYIFKGNKLKKRRHPWTKFFNVLYVDNPVGVGFSFTDSDKGYSTNQTMVSENLHEALRQFLILFPQIRKNKVILSGESYAGKYLPFLADTIYRKKATVVPKINVHGIFVGNPLIVPEDMLTHYNAYFRSHGLLDSNGQEKMRKREELILSLIHSKQWVEAADLFMNTFCEAHTNKTTLFEELTGIRNHYNMLLNKISLDGAYVNFLNQRSTKSKLHVRDEKFGINDWTVYLKMKSDIMKPIKTTMGTVLENFRVLIYSGQFDIICPYYLQSKVSENMPWSGNWQYTQSERRLLNWGRTVCGYYKTAKQYTEVMIRNAGHFVPTDKPQWVLGLLQKFAKSAFDNSTSPSVDINY